MSFVVNGGFRGHFAATVQVQKACEAGDNIADYEGAETDDPNPPIVPKTSAIKAKNRNT